MGTQHAKKRKYTTPEEQVALVAEYQDGATQTALAEKYGITQNAVSKLLQRLGVKARTQTEAQPPTFDVAEAARLWAEEKRTTYEIATLLGVSQSVVGSHLLRAGISKSKGRGQRYRHFDREFFTKVTHESAYFAGFVAADGCVHGENDTVSFGLHPNDRVVLENLRAAAKLEQPITERNNNFGKPYVWMSVTSQSGLSPWSVSIKLRPRSP
jgi:predicted transcriptional regulator